VIVFVTPDGTHIDSSDSESKLLRKYRVSSQNVAPNTKIKSAFDKDEDGKEYDNLTIWNSIDEIVLAVDEVGKSGNSIDMTKIKASPNNSTAYIRDYVGRNLADCGYISMTGKFVDGYTGGSYVQLDVNANDGSYVDVSDSKSLSQYRVTAQSVEPNTELTFEHEKDEDGTEYSNLAINQSISSITLSVEKISK
jgi:protein required for attachment to host cells